MFTILANKYKTKNFTEFKLPAKVLLNGVISYVEKDLNNRVSEFDSLCENVNFKKMEKEDLTKLYAKKKWLQKSSSFLNQIILKDMSDNDDDSESKSDSEEESEEKDDSEDSGKKYQIEDPISKKMVKKWSFTTGWIIKRGTKLTKGKHTIKVKIEQLSFSGNTWALIIGVINDSHQLNTHLGAYNTGWGYIASGYKNHASSSGLAYGEKYGAGDTITLILNLSKGTIEFKKNKKSQGVAFTNIKGPVYLAISGTTQSNGKIL